MPVYNQTLAIVIDAGREIRLLNPGNPVVMTCFNRPEGYLSTVKYTLPDNKGGIQFRVYVPSSTEYTLSVHAWPAHRFHQKVLPGEPLFHGPIQEEGFLDPPMNTIPFEVMRLRSHLSEKNTPTIWFALTEAAVINAGVRLLLTKFAFSD